MTATDQLTLQKDTQSAPPQRPESIDWETLDRMDWHLWVLSISLISVLGISLLSFMFPSVFWVTPQFASDSSERIFFGYLVLMSLTLVYLLQRQATIRQLRRQLMGAQSAVANAELESAIQSFVSLPDSDQFRDTLAMTYRRCSSCEMPLAIAVFADPSAKPETLGRMVYAMRPMLRRGESLYRISEKAVGVILPGMEKRDVTAFAARVEEVSGFPKGHLYLTIAAYPDEVKSLAELEMQLRNTAYRRSLHSDQEPAVLYPNHAASIAQAEASA